MKKKLEDNNNIEDVLSIQNDEESVVQVEIEEVSEVEQPVLVEETTIEVSPDADVFISVDEETTEVEVSPQTEQSTLVEQEETTIEVSPEVDVSLVENDTATTVGESPTESSYQEVIEEETPVDVEGVPETIVVKDMASFSDPIFTKILNVKSLLEDEIFDRPASVFKPKASLISIKLNSLKRVYKPEKYLSKVELETITITEETKTV